MGLRSVRSGGFFQNPGAHIDDKGCSRRVELGLDRRRSRKGTATIPRSRCPRPVRMPRSAFAQRGATCWFALAARMSAPLAHPFAQPATEAQGAKRVLASAGKHVRGAESSEGVSTFRIVLQKSFDDVEPKEAEYA